MENDGFFEKIYTGLIEAAEEAMKEDGWEEWDMRYKDIPLGKMLA
jgi:hypothetical protein